MDFEIVSSQEQEDKKELKDILVLVFDAQDAAKSSKGKDGKFQFDFSSYFQLINSGKAAYENVGRPIERWRRLSDAGRQELKEYAFTRFDLADDVLEMLIEDTFNEIEGDIRLVSRWNKYLKKSA